MNGKSFKYAITIAALASAMGFSLAAVAAGRAFVPLGSADAVGVIGLDGYQAQEEISGTVNTHGSALTPDGKYLVAGSLTPRDTKAEIGRPEGVSQDEHEAHHGGGNGSAEMTNTGLLYMVDTASGGVARKLEVPGPVHHVLVTSNGRYAVSTHPMGGSISVVSLESGNIVETVATGPSPNYAVESDDGQSLYVSNTGNGTVSEVDTKHWFVRRNLRVGGSPEHMVLSPDGDRLFVNDVSGGRVAVVGLAQGNVAADYAVGKTPHGVGLSADGTMLYATARGDDRLVRIDLRSGARKSVTLAPAPYHLAVNPEDGRLLVTSREERRLWVIDPDQLSVEHTLPLAGIGHQISLGTD